MSRKELFDLIDTLPVEAVERLGYVAQGIAMAQRAAEKKEEDACACALGAASRGTRGETRER